MWGGLGKASWKKLILTGFGNKMSQSHPQRHWDDGCGWGSWPPLPALQTAWDPDSALNTQGSPRGGIWIHSSNEYFVRPSHEAGPVPGHEAERDEVPVFIQLTS